MEQVNFLQRVGHASCIRCDFETSDRMSFEEQNAAMNAHLTEKHPDWMTDGGASIRKDRLPKPAPTEAVVARMQGEIDALKAELAEARKPRRIALIGGVGSVIANALQDASRTAPEPVKTGGCAPPVLASTPELVMCANCDDPIIEGPSSFWTHRAGHSCCGPNRFAKPPAGAAQDDIVVQICRVMAPHLYGLLLEECNEKAVGRLRDAVAAALAIAREGWICRGEMTEYKPLYEELIKRLEGAHIVASLPGIFEWSHTIEELIKATNAQKHLAQLATDRYEKILELERKLAEPHEGYYSAELVEKALRGFYALPYGPEANDLVRVVFYLLAKEAK
jgi:hypothetical protein